MMSKILEFKDKGKAVGKFEIKNQTEDFAELYIYGDIVSSEWMKWDDTDITPQDIVDFLKEIDGKNKLNIYINSGGGSVFAGLAIYNQLKRHNAEKTVYVDGLAGSIASVIALVGDRVVIPSNAFLMIHKPWMGLWGAYNANDFRKMADDLDRIEEGIMNVYKENIKEGVDIETIRQMVQDETWLTGEEAAKYFKVEVSEAIEAVACVSDYFDRYKNVPESFKRVKKSKDRDQEKEKMLVEIDLI